MKNKNIIYPLIFAIILPVSVFCDIGIRAGLGSYFASDTLFKEAYANAYMAELRFHLNEIAFATGGVKIYNIHNKNVPIAMLLPTGSSDITIGSYKHRVDALCIEGGVGAGTFFGKSKTGVYFYAQAAVGLISPLISQRIEYYTGTDTSTTFASFNKDRNWAFLFNPCVGIEGRFMGIGLFVQGDYLWGNSVKYDPVEVENIKVFPGGEITPSGWIIFVGVVID